MDTMKLFEKTVKEQEIYSGRIIRVHLDDVVLENGSETKREVVDHPGGVSVAVLTENNELILVRQFRYPYKQVLLELPAGKLEQGEDPFEAVKREQREETGTVGEHYISLGNVYPTPGYCGEIIRMYLARDLSFGDTDPDEDEFLGLERVPFSQLVEQVLSGEIKDAKTIAAVLKVKLLGL